MIKIIAKLDTAINLGFEDSAVEDNEEETYTKNEIKAADIMPETRELSKFDGIFFRGISFTEEIDVFRK